MLVTRFHPCCLVLDLLLLVQSLWLQASSASRSQPVEALYGGASTVSDPVLSAAFTVTPQPTPAQRQNNVICQLWTDRRQ